MIKSIIPSKSKLRFLFECCFPFLFTFGLIIISLLPWQLTFITYFSVPLTYASLFYWIVFKNHLMTPFVVFVLGLLADLLTVAPLGFHTLLFLLFYSVVYKNRYFLRGRSFLFLWLCFAICCAGLAITQWALSSLLFLAWQSLSFFIVQEILLVATFPFMTMLCSVCASAVFDEE